MSLEAKSRVLRLLDGLKACSRSGNVEKGKALHEEALRNGDLSNGYVATSLVSMYAKCSSLVNARAVFDDACHGRCVATWNALMFGYVENGESEAALLLFSRMQEEHISQSALTFVAALKACTSLAKLEQGMVIYWQALRSSRDIRVENTAMDMYAKCRCMVDAAATFNRISIPDDISWNVLIAGYAENGKEALALELFTRMGLQGCEPTARTFVACLKACIYLAGKDPKKPESLEEAMNIHFHAAKGGHDTDPYVASSLVDLYARYCIMVDARIAFDRMKVHDVASWNALLYGYAENGEEERALQLYRRMQDEGCAPSARTFAAAIKACIGLASKERGQEIEGKLVKIESRTKGIAIHQRIEKTGCSDIRVATSLIDFYSTCGVMADARSVFDSLQDRDIIMWNALLSGYAENGEAETVLEMFSRMEAEGFAPDAVSYLVALKACGTLGALEFGKTLHSKIRNRRLDDEQGETLAATIVDFYGKCGSMVEAQQVFDSFEKNAARHKGLVLWTALMTGYSFQGNTDRVLELFESMQNEQVQPDDITFLSVLTACSHAGLVEKGKEYFESMHPRFGIKPNLKHYTCVLDMLGRANKLDEVAGLLESMPFAADSVTWTAILASCRDRKNAGIRRAAFDSLVSSGEHKSGAYIAAASTDFVFSDIPSNR